jgi:hypothetical protein
MSTLKAKEGPEDKIRLKRMEIPELTRKKKKQEMQFSYRNTPSYRKKSKL